MRKLLLGLLLDTASIFLVTQILPFVTADSLLTAAVVAIVYGLLKMLFRGVLVLLTLPLMIVTFGLFWFVINAFLLWITDWLIAGFEITGFFNTIITSVLISVIDTVLNSLAKEENKR